MMADQVSTVLNLKSLMERQIVGQSHALDRIAQIDSHIAREPDGPAHADRRVPACRHQRCGQDGNRAVVLAELLYGGEQNMTVINMSEFKEEHKVSLLMGSPPGYVGYGEGGVLTEAVRRKAVLGGAARRNGEGHPGVQDIFYQVFDKGTLQGRRRARHRLQEHDHPDDHECRDRLHQESVPRSGHRPRAGRVRVGAVSRVAEDVQAGVSGAGDDHSLLSAVGRGDAEDHRAEAREDGTARRGTLQGDVFVCDPQLVDTIAQRCTEVDTGARNIDHILTRTLLPEMSAEFLGRMAERKTIREVRITVADDETFRYEIS